LNEAKLLLDDLSVGQCFTSRTRTIDAEQIVAFAKEFDPQPFHVDAAAAVKTFFVGLAASGWHTAALTMSLIVESVPIAGGVIGANAEISWKKPVRAEDDLHVVSEVVQITPSRSKPGQGIVLLRSETRSSDDEVVQVLTSTLVVPRKTSNAAQEV
jgi:acyl dehydratase